MEEIDMKKKIQENWFSERKSMTFYFERAHRLPSIMYASTWPGQSLRNSRTLGIKRSCILISLALLPSLPLLEKATTLVKSNSKLSLCTQPSSIRLQKNRAEWFCFKLMTLTPSGLSMLHYSWYISMIHSLTDYFMPSPLLLNSNPLPASSLSANNLPFLLLRKIWKQLKERSSTYTYHYNILLPASWDQCSTYSH